MKFEGYENPVPHLEAPALVENCISVNTSSAENYQCYQIESNQLNTSELSVPCG